MELLMLSPTPLIPLPTAPTASPATEPAVWTALEIVGAMALWIVPIIQVVAMLMIV
jgi:hypothetical protein